MRIGLDSRNLRLAGGTGVSIYVSAVEAALRARGNRPVPLLSPQSEPGPARWLRRHAYALGMRRRLETTEDDRLSARELNAAAHIRFGLGRTLTRVATPSPLDAMHLTYPLPLHVEGCPNIVTVHDVIPCHRPELTGIDGTRLRRLLKALDRQGAIWVTVSETTRQDMAATLGIPADRIANLSQPMMISATDRLAAEEADPVAPAGSFVVFGTVERRKNIGRIIAAHARSRTVRPLVIIGGNGFGAEGEWRALETHPHPERVIAHPWCERPRLLRSIIEARAVLFPSLAEGFGLPIIEGMALGTPVLTSKGGATEEIAGGAALLVDPLDVPEMAESLARLDTDDALCATLRASGLERATAFSPEGFADRLERFYRHVVGKSRAT
ncbi:glycosyltransferase family 4 protein [Acidomonas methanolica]|uniref:glycosyltransferase family 4 protein n=1 Tax=Acidomonas methanolica TaxID=437 RepID=UPI00130E3317|nr:glycosyltransferase family 1 protein [Acidomonas methanolica]